MRKDLGVPPKNFWENYGSKGKQNVQPSSCVALRKTSVVALTQHSCHDLCKTSQVMKVVP